MRTKNLFLCMGSVLFLLAGCEEYTSGEEIIQSVAPAIWDPGETWNAPSTFGLDTDLWPATQYARAAGIITIPSTGSLRGWCSASIIGTNRIATAEHCLANTSMLSNVGFTPSIFTEFSNVPLGVRSDVASARRGLESIGFRGTALDDAIDTVKPEAARLIASLSATDNGSEHVWKTYNSAAEIGSNSHSFRRVKCPVNSCFPLSSFSWPLAA